MTNRTLIRKIILLYRKARKSKFPSVKIRRGRSHSISSSTEDLFAKFLVKKINVDGIYIDQPISIESYKNQQYPDISLVKNKKIIAFCDLKMDMGWNRHGLFDLCRRQNTWIKSVRGRKCKIIDGITKVSHIYQVSPSVTYNIVIISDQNINKLLLENQITKSKKLEPGVEVFILSSKEHPNTYGISVDRLMRKIRVENGALSRLINKLNRT